MITLYHFRVMLPAPMARATRPTLLQPEAFSLLLYFRLLIFTLCSLAFFASFSLKPMTFSLPYLCFLPFDLLLYSLFVTLTLDVRLWTFFRASSLQPIAFSLFPFIHLSLIHYPLSTSYGVTPNTCTAYVNRTVEA